MPENPSSLLQTVDDPTRVLARRLMRAARYASLSVLESDSQWPAVSRAAVATDVDGALVLLISALSAHTQALMHDPRCSLLLGEPGKGDPLAHARITVYGQARCLVLDSAERERVRQRYLARLPKSALYADFGDFSFWRIEPTRASLNGGFGRAYELHARDLLSTLQVLDEFHALACSVCEHMNRDHSAAVAQLAHGVQRTHAATIAPTSSDQVWEMVTLDPNGFELRRGDELLRQEFSQSCTDALAVRAELMRLVKTHQP